MSATTTTTPRRNNWWISMVTETYRAALAAWEAEAEAVAIGYETELAEFAESNPKPLFKDFLIQMSGMGAEEE